MKFRKIDDTKFQCILNREDMMSLNISMEDFLRNDAAKIHELLDIVIEEAYDKIGVDMDGTVMSLQLVPQPNESLLLTVTGRREEGGMMRTIGRELSDSLPDIFGASNTLEKKDKTAITVAEALSLPIVFRFNGMEHVEDFCMACEHSRGIRTSLFKGDDGAYYMLAQRTRLSERKYVSFIVKILEYSQIYSSNELEIINLKEHCEPVVIGNAVNTIKKYCQ